MTHRFILSDIHLCEAITDDGLWMRYRHARYFPDPDISAFMSRMDTLHRGEKIEFIFNGDIFDFDAPPVVDGKVHFDDLPRTEPVSAKILARILDHHPVFCNALGRAVANGHKLVFISGNHDAQMTFPRVRDVLRTRIINAAKHLGMPNPNASLVDFRSWFYEADGIHVEHGNQYDWLCSFRYPTEPFTADGTAIQPNMGSLTFRHLVSRMGYFNPYVDNSFMLSLPKYIAHWKSHYLFTKKTLVWAWVKGTVRTVVASWRTRSKPDAARTARLLGTANTEADRKATENHAKLFAPPSEDRLYRVFRELWVDRMGLAATGLIATVSAAISSGKVASAGAVAGTVVGIAGYEMAISKPTLNDVYDHINNRARDIAKIYGRRAVIFGHTHLPHGKIEDGVFYGNSGTWSASYTDTACTELIPYGRTVIWLTSDNGNVTGGLYAWRDGELKPFERT